MKIPKILTETPNFDVPTGIVSDSDRDGVIDPWDCQPFNPDEDGLIGDLVSGAGRRISSGGRTVQQGISTRVQQVRQTIGGRVRPVVQRVQQTTSRLPIHPSRRRAAERRGAVKQQMIKVKRAFSPEAKARRGAKIKGGVIRGLTDIAGMGASTRRQIVQGTAVPSAGGGGGGWQGALGIAAHLAGRQPQVAPTQPTGSSYSVSKSYYTPRRSRQPDYVPSWSSLSQKTGEGARARFHGYAMDKFPEPDTSSPKW